MSSTIVQPNIVQTGAPPQPVLQLGNLDPPNGVISNYTASAPQDFNGWVAENQQIETNDTVQPNSIPFPDPTTAPNTYWADGCWIYNVGINLVNNGAIAAPKGSYVSYGPTYDAPRYYLDTPGVTQWNIDDKFTDYFMYRPKVKGWNAIWVNFGVLQWAWGGTANLAAGGGGNAQWTLANGFGGVTSSGQPTTALVGWPNILPGEPGTCPNGPAVTNHTPPARKLRLRPPSGRAKTVGAVH